MNDYAVFFKAGRRPIDRVRLNAFRKVTARAGEPELRYQRDDR